MVQIKERAGVRHDAYDPDGQDLSSEEEDADDDGDMDGQVDNDNEDEDDADEEDEKPCLVDAEMEQLQTEIFGPKSRYRFIKRIGEGTFSTVYKAEDLEYDHSTDPPLQSSNSGESRTARFLSLLPNPRFVAIKKIYVTSSPARILNELELLSDLVHCPTVCPLLTAFRHSDQVVAVLPYFRHADFRHYFRDMTIPDVVIYMRSLFTALRAVHEQLIVHRDIKPTNFLYDPVSRSGVLVDFGLAEREGMDSKPCLCHETREYRHKRIQDSVVSAAGPQNGYPKDDTRPSRRANRAGTRGFRAPEVLFKCTEQSTKIDVWSAGVILLTILSKRFPFFNSADDVDAMIEMAHIFGVIKMRRAGLLHGCMFETNIPTITGSGYSLEKIILWSTARDGSPARPLAPEEKLAVEFLQRCLDLDPGKRISAAEAVQHEFLRDEPNQPPDIGVDEDEMDLIDV